MNDVISVIVPIYNVEQYLEKCIQSIQNQTYQNLEIILVDDGSPDACGKICDDYAAKDQRIKVIHKENGGLSDARNFGIDAATGKYFFFVDSDDYIHCDIVRILYEAVKANGAQVSVCSYQSVDEQETVAYEQPYTGKIEPVVMTEKQLYDPLYYFEKRVEFIVAWNKLYHHSLFDGVRYPKGKLHEDEFTTYKLLYKAKGVVYVDSPLYYYVQRSSSIMGQQFNEKRLHALEAMMERMDFYGEKNEERLWALDFESYRRAFLRDVGEIRKDGTFPKRKLKPYQKYYNQQVGKYNKLSNQSFVQKMQYKLSGWMPFLYSALLERNR